MNKVVQFTLLRLALLLVPLIVLILAGVNEFVALVIAAVFSMVTSLFVLRKPREEMAQQLADKVAQRRARREGTLAAERTDEEIEDAEDERP